tara:strand:+ start:1282 stop:2184 length:903 start_codon:yes stop_codon:yes gene_type:complete
MKLTEQRLYELIKEEMERSFFGKGVQQIIDTQNAIYKKGPFLDTEWIQKNIGKRIGAGYSREVYGIDHGGAPIGGTVIKFAIGDPNTKSEGIQSNMMEIKAFNKHPHVFPRTYTWDRSKGGPEWFVVEKVDVVEDGREMNSVLTSAYSSLRKAANFLSRPIDISPGISIDGFTYYNDLGSSWVFERILDAYSDDDGDAMGMWLDEIFHSRAVKRMFKSLADSVDADIYREILRDRLEKIIIARLEEAWSIATNNEKLMRFVTTCKELGVDFDEIREGNVATDEKKSRLILIDISIFNKFV